MTRKQTHVFLISEVPFYAGLTTKNQNLFLSSFLNFNRIFKFRISPEIKESERYSMLVGAILTHIRFTKVDFNLEKVFKSISLVSNTEYEENKEEMFRNFEIPVRYDTENFLHQGLYDIIYGFYSCFLLNKNALQHFATHVGKVEMLMIDRFDFQNRSSLPQCVNPANDGPLHMLAYFSEQFFNHSLQLRESDPQLYYSFVDLWNFNPLSNLMQENVNSKKKFENPNKASRPKSFLHPVYNFGLISVFIGTFALILLFQYTIIYSYLIWILIFAFSLSGLHFVQVLKKRKITILKIPFLFFSVFGVGCNSVALLLLMNFFTSYFSSDKSIVLPFSKEIIVRTENAGTGYINYYAKLKFGSSSKKIIPFRANVFQVPSFFVIKLKKGIFGFYVIWDKKTIY